MKKITLATTLPLSAFSFSTFSALAADQVSKEEVAHYKLVKIGNIQVAESGGKVGSPSELHEELSKLADEKGGKYYHIIAAGQKGPNFEAIATVYKDAEK